MAISASLDTPNQTYWSNSFIETTFSLGTRVTKIGPKILIETTAVFILFQNLHNISADLLLKFLEDRHDEPIGDSELRQLPVLKLLLKPHWILFTAYLPNPHQSKRIQDCQERSIICLRIHRASFRSLFGHSNLSDSKTWSPSSNINILFYYAMLWGNLIIVENFFLELISSSLQTEMFRPIWNFGKTFWKKYYEIKLYIYAEK